MREEVILTFFSDEELTLRPAPPELAPTADDGRRWLEDAFVANDCEPLRMSGKVLTIDKMLAIPLTVGEKRFRDDPAFAAAYARAVLAAMARPVVRINVPQRSVSG